MINDIYLGAELKVVINGTLVAECNGIDISCSYIYHPLMGVDSVQIFEQVPISISVNGSLSFYRLRFVGGMEGRSALATFKTFTQQKYSTLQVFDRSLAQEYLRVEQVTFERQSFSIHPKDIVTGAMSFNGISFVTEFNPQD